MPVWMVKPELSLDPISSTQPNPYRGKNFDAGPNPTHNPTEPRKQKQFFCYKKYNFRKIMSHTQLQDLSTCALAISVHYISAFN